MLKHNNSMECLGRIIKVKSHFTWEDIVDYGMNLVVTLYPTKKVVPLS